MFPNGTGYNSSMRIIFIRGLPGTGKTSVAKELINKLDGKVVHIWVDNFKIEAGLDNFPKAIKTAYEKTISVLNDCLSQDVDWVVIEEILYDKGFISTLQEFVKKNNIKAYWFLLERPLDVLLTVENKRNRKIKNSKEDFEDMKKKLEETSVEGETVIENTDLYETVNNIASVVR